MTTASVLALLLSGVGSLALVLISMQLQELRSRIARIETWLWEERKHYGG